MTLQARELRSVLNIKPPKEMLPSTRVRIYGGGTLVFDQYGQVKFKIANLIEDHKRQTARLRYLWESGEFDKEKKPEARFAQLHRARMSMGVPRCRRLNQPD